MSGFNVAVIQAPSAPARPWLTRVAHRMPATIGTGFLKRAARMNASNWVLSPISASATTAVETSSESMGSEDIRPLPGSGALSRR